MTTVKWQGLEIYTVYYPITLQHLWIMFLLAWSYKPTHHTYCRHTHTHTHTHEHSAHTPAGEAVQYPTPAPPYWVLRLERCSKGRGGLCRGVEGSDYLSLCMSISVGPIPPSAVPLSPQATHTSSFVLLSIFFLFSSLSDNSKHKFNIVKMWI